jgi:hypothetical protein
MKKILIALVTVPFLMAPMLSFSVLAVDTPLTSTSIPDNVPNGGDNSCPHQGGGACSSHK